MHTHYCFAEPALWATDSVRLPEAEEHYLIRVLRAAQGDAITVLDGQGRRARARIEMAAGREVRLHVEEVTAIPARAAQITLLQCIPKGDRMDLIVEKAVELGVSALVPVASERVILRLNERQRRERVQRWERVAVSALKQSGAAWLPRIAPVCDFASVLPEMRRMDACVCGSLRQGAASLHAVAAGWHARPPRTVGLLIGPEGDLTDAEQDAAQAAGAAPVRFGPTVLRVETAALFGLAVLTHELDRPA